MRKKNSLCLWKGFLFAFLWTMSLGVFAQNITVSGTITDSQNEPVIGATILVKGTSSGTVTDIDGNYTLSNVPSNATLQVTYVGMRGQEVDVNGRTIINLQLESDTELLDEVVVVGFGTQKKENLTGAVSAVKMDDVLGNRPVTSLGSSLQGVIPGFTTSSSPIPGGGNSFNVRGFESITGGAPLILVDNVVYNDLKSLNPADIESVSVLKDASSAAIYGARASFGVILITTKKGKNNEPLTLSYNNNFATSNVHNLPKLASPTDFINALSEGGYTSLWSGQNIERFSELLSEYDADPASYPRGWVDEGGTKYFLRENDIMGDMFENSWKQTHNLSIRGGSERINYRISLGYTSEDGILITNKDMYKRTNVSSYVSGKITEWLSTSLDVKFNSSAKEFPSTDNMSRVSLWPSNNPSYHPIGTLPVGADGEEYPVMTPSNVINLVEPSENLTNSTRLLSRTVVNPFSGFEAVLEYSYQTNLEDYQQYANKFTAHQGLSDNTFSTTQTTPFTFSRATTNYTSLNAFLSFNKSFDNKHNVSAILGYNQEYNDYRYLWSRAYNMISQELPSISGSDGQTPPETTDNYNEYALRGSFFRATYNYMQRYFIELNGRYDLSSKFPKDYRGGFFPSISGAWNLINEPYMTFSHNVFSQLKVRSSYGTLGNQNVDNYGYLPTMNPVNSNWINNGLVPTTLNPPAMVRATYTWEKVSTLNGGLDFGFINNQLTGSFDIYQRNTIGMIAPSEEFPAVSGAAAPNQNAADMETNGWELSLNWRDQLGKLNYGLGFNIYNSKSTIKKYKNETKSLSAPYYEGQRIGEIWGYVTDGFYTSDDFDSSGVLNPDVVSIQGVVSHEGDIKYKNLMDDDSSTNIINTGDNTVFNPGDRKIIGNSRPQLQYGFNGYAEYEGFSLSFLLQGTAKRDAWIDGNMIFPMAGQFGTIYEHQVGKIWTPDNKDNAFYGRIYENAGSSQSANQRVSDKFLSDASYLRVKNITLSYMIPVNFLKKISVENLKVFVSGENLFTFDNLPSGIDPESLGWSYPHYRTISFGINLNL